MMTFNKIVLSALLVPVILFSILNCTTAQEDQRMQYYPASSQYYAGLNVYSVTTAKMDQYYVLNGEWVMNTAIPQPEISISGGDYRMTFYPGDSLTHPGLFVYSTVSGEFEILFLSENSWKPNPKLPGSVINLNSGVIRLDFVLPDGPYNAYLTAYSTDGRSFGIYHLINNEWVKNDLFP